jgi:hypothetical protein
MIVTVKEQTTQWPKEKAQKDKQRSTKHTNKNGYSQITNISNLLEYFQYILNQNITLQ